MHCETSMLTSVCKVARETVFQLRGIQNPNIERKFTLNFTSLMGDGSTVHFPGNDGQSMFWNVSSGVIEIEGQMRSKPLKVKQPTPFGLQKAELFSEGRVYCYLI